MDRYPMDCCSEMDHGQSFPMPQPVPTEEATMDHYVHHFVPPLPATSYGTKSRAEVPMGYGSKSRNEVPLHSESGQSPYSSYSSYPPYSRTYGPVHGHHQIHHHGQYLHSAPHPQSMEKSRSYDDCSHSSSSYAHHAPLPESSQSCPVMPSHGLPGLQIITE